MEERGKVVCLAKLAEQAERYDGEGSACPVLFCFSSVQCRRPLVERGEGLGPCSIDSACLRQSLLTCVQNV
jgi:hypothetical protein